MPQWMRNLNPFGGGKSPSERFSALLTPDDIKLVRYIGHKLGPEHGAQMIGIAEQMELLATDEGRANLTDEKAVHYARNISAALSRAGVGMENRFTPGVSVLEGDGWTQIAGETPDEKWRDKQTLRELKADMDAVVAAASADKTRT